MSSWAIFTGRWLTVRKTFCCVVNPEGETVFIHRRFWPCVAFLDEIEISEYLIYPDADERSVRPPIVVNRKATATWQK